VATVVIKSGISLAKLGADIVKQAPTAKAVIQGAINASTSLSPHEVLNKIASSKSYAAQVAQGTKVSPTVIQAVAKVASIAKK
jgi:hypothetical protein